MFQHARRASVKRNGEPFFAWPGWTILVYYLLLGTAIALWFAIVYGACDWITAHRSLRLPLHFPWESRIPFMPWMSAFYLSIFPLFWAIPFILRTRAELLAMAKAAGAVIGVAGIGFLLAPAGSAHPIHEGTGLLPGLFRFADWLNLDHNDMPSLHVALAVLCVAVLARKAGPAGKGALWIWAAAVSVSTLVTHQHHVLDVATGVLLGLVGAYGFYLRFIRLARQ